MLTVAALMESGTRERGEKEIEVWAGYQGRDGAKDELN